MRKQQTDNGDYVSQRRALQRSVDEQAHSRGEESAQGVLRLVDRELERCKGYGSWLSENDCDELHLCALRGFLEGLRDDLVDTVGLDRFITQRIAADVFGIEAPVRPGALTPGRHAIEEAYEALIGRNAGLGAEDGAGPGDPCELSEHLGDYVVQLVSAASRHEQADADALLLESRLLRIVLNRITLRMCELPDIGVACAHAALADANALFEQRLTDAERTSNEESARLIDRAMRKAREND